MSKNKVARAYAKHAQRKECGRNQGTMFPVAKIDCDQPERYRQTDKGPLRRFRSDKRKTEPGEQAKCEAGECAMDRAEGANPRSPTVHIDPH